MTHNSHGAFLYEKNSPYQVGDTFSDRKQRFGGIEK